MLEDSSKKELLMSEFEKTEDYTMSYFEFYTLLHDQILVNKEDLVPEWVFSSFESYLDEMNQARIGIVPLIKLFHSYGFSIGYDYENDAGYEYAQKLKAENELEPEQYQLTEADYFRGVKSILNSEKAALAAAIALYKNCRNGEQWKDSDFGPTDDDEHGAYSLFCQGETPPKNPFDLEDVQWLDPAEVLEEDEQDEQGDEE